MIKPSAVLMLITVASVYVAVAWADNDQLKQIDLTRLAREACIGLPNSAEVTVKQTVGDAGSVSINAGTAIVYSLTVNCGELRHASMASPSDSAGNGGSPGGDGTKL